MTGDAEGGGGNSRRVIMSVRSSKIVNSMTLDAGRVRGNGNHPWPISRILETWWIGMTVPTLVGVDGHRVVAPMTAYTERSIEYMTKTFRCGSMIYLKMGSRRLFVHMTAQAIHRTLVRIFDDHFHRGASRCCRVDVTTGIMTSGATSKMSCHNIRPVLDRVTIGAGLRACLPKIGSKVDQHGMINQTACRAMIMADKISGVAGDTFPTTGNRRSLKRTVGRSIVTGSTAINRMHLTGANKWCDGGDMTADAVGRSGCRGQVLFDLSSVVMVMAVKVATMALSTGTAIAAVDSGIPVAVSAIDQSAVNTGMTKKTVIGMNSRDDTASMTIYAQRG